MNGLAECGLVETVHRVVERGTPFLGICVGMQILFSESIEFGRVQGLDILKGTVRRSILPLYTAIRFRTWAGISFIWNIGNSARRILTVSKRASAYTSSIPTTPFRMTPRSLRPRQSTARPLPPRMVGQRIRHTIPPGKEPNCRSAHSCQFRQPGQRPHVGHHLPTP